MTVTRNQKNAKRRLFVYKGIMMKNVADTRNKLLSSKTPAEHRFEGILNDLGIKYKREFPVRIKNGHFKYIDFFVGRHLSAKNKNTKKAERKNLPQPWYGVGFEIDGKIHDGQQYYDINRDTQIIDSYLNHIFIVRFKNEEIFEMPDVVKNRVIETLKQMKLR